MRAVLLTLAGLLLVAAGGIGLYLGYGSEAPVIAALSFACVIVGAVVLMFGASGISASKPAAVISIPKVRHEEWQVHLLIQCMGAVAAADGAVSPDELATVSRISERLTGSRIPDDEIAATVAALKGPAVAARLASERERISPAMRQMMVKGCYLVMMSDLSQSRKELGKVHEIGRALGFSAREIDDQIAMAGV